MHNDDYLFDDQYTETELKEISLCASISEGLSSLIREKREKALQSLNSGSLSASSKKEALNDYFRFIMSPEDCKVCVGDNSYSIVDLENLGKHMLHDERLNCYIVFDSLNFYRESFTRDDVVLSRHNFRLSRDAESLSYMVSIISHFVRDLLLVDGTKFDVEIPTTIMDIDTSIRALNKVLEYIDNYLLVLVDNVDKYSGKYHLEQDKLVKYSERLDDLASQYFSKQSPVEIHAAYLIDFFKSRFVLSNPFLWSVLESTILNFYSKYCANYDGKASGIDVAFPTFHDLINYVEEEEKSNQEVINALKQIEKDNSADFLNKQLIISQEEYQRSVKLNREIVVRSMFENLPRCMWTLYSVTQCLEEISEWVSDVPEVIPQIESEEKTENRLRIIDEICRIFDEYGAYSKIERSSSDRPIIAKERRIESRKNDLLKASLDLLNNTSYEEIMARRSKILSEARSICPEEVDFIDECSNRIISKLQAKIDPKEIGSIILEMNRLLNKEGILKDDIIKTLATAEMLYRKYANDDFALSGFDYSCISSLYYQAFEVSYNDLIWNPYATMLNNLVIADQSYPDILQSKWRRDKRGLFLKTDVGFGFLPSRQNDWNYYIEYNNNTTTIKASCMYGSFKEFMMKAGEMPRFKEWLAHKIDFDDENKLFENHSFSILFNSFVDDIKAATDNRNNASHGGRKISRDQCQIDRETVIVDVRKIHDLYLGLIQKLIAVLKFKE